jgi:hypothetical protein
MKDEGRKSQTPNPKSEGNSKKENSKTPPARGQQAEAWEEWEEWEEWER